MSVLIPARCTATLPEVFTDNHVCEPKVDGARYQFYIGYDPTGRHAGNTLLSRHISKVDNLPVDKTHHVIGLGSDWPDLKGTVLDGEVFAQDFTFTQSILNCSPAKAIERQSTSMILNYYVFDCRVFRGEDIGGLPLEKRRMVARAVVDRLNLSNVVLIQQWPFDRISEMFNQIIAAGGEGLIVKDKRFAYGCGWSKLKKSYDVSCFISGYKPGNGKYRDSIGAIALSVYDNSPDDDSEYDARSIEIGFASGFSDEIRAAINSNRDAYLGKVVDVYAQELSSGNRLRHPTFFRFRSDVSHRDCTLVNVKEAFKQKAKSRRIK
jgi:ATP-dependent DNA ligase